MKLPIRVRLTAAFAVVLAVVLAAVGVFVYQRFRSDADRTINAELRSRTTAFFAARDPGPQLRVDLLGLADERFGQVLDRRGTVVARSAQLTNRPIAGPTPGRSDATVATRREQRRVRLLVTSRDGTTLLLATALDDRDGALAQLASLLWIGAGLTFLVATVLAWLLAGAALRPVERLRGAAAAYSAADLTKRLAVPPSNDELHRLAVTLNQMLARIEDAFEQQRSFVDRASHELRTPIANLSLELELALRNERDMPQLRAALEGAADETRRLDRLAANLLVVARSTDGSVPLAQEDSDLAELVRATVDSFSARAAAEGVEVTTDAVEPVHVPIDPTIVRQALTNLLDNALRVTPPGGRVRVEVRALRDEAAVSVADSGPGFAPGIEEAAFGLFVRGPAGHRSETGAGLGLAVVRGRGGSRGPGDDRQLRDGRQGHDRPAGPPIAAFIRFQQSMLHTGSRDQPGAAPPLARRGRRPEGPAETPDSCSSALEGTTRSQGHGRVGAMTEVVGDTSRSWVGCRRRRSVGPPRKTPHALLVAVAVACCSVAMTGCGGGTSSEATPPLHRVPIDPANFVDPTTSTNRFHPLRPGMQWVREGTTEAGHRVVPHQVISTMTDVIRMIDGVPTVVMLDQDTDAGQITQASLDYMGLDNRGNVWLFGGYTEAYSAGEFTNTIDAWLGKQSGGAPGILVPADPRVGMPRWFVANSPGEGGTAAEVVDTGTSRCVPFSCYKDVLIVREGKIEAIDNEFKFYAPDVGQVRNSPRRDSKHNDVEELVNLVQLSPAGLAEIDDEVQRLEAHARTTEPKVFGSAPDSTRAR